MSAEETLLQVRKDKHQELNNGTYPLATTKHVWSVVSLLTDIDSMIREKEIATTVSLNEAEGNGSRILHGRLAAIRKTGALTFMKLTDATGSVQLVAARDNLVDYEKVRLLDLGDIVEVTGEPVLTKTGERSLLLSSWKVLTKSHRPPPEKFAGIADQELKSRKRYLDLMSSEESRARFVTRSTAIRGIREYMDGQGFLDVETSTLSSVASGANAKPFTTHHNALDVDLRLRIAPELNLKRLLVGGFDKVFEIGRNYRNEGIDSRHNPEFTMMESYQAYGNFPYLLTFTKALLQHVDNFCNFYCPPWARPHYLEWAANRSFTLNEFAEVTMEQAVYQACDKAGIHIEWDGQNQLHDLKYSIPGNERLSKIDTSSMWRDIDQSNSRGSVTAALFEHVAEPFLTEDYRTGDGTKSLPIFITQYPKEICPLARASDHNYFTCDRFELFIEGRELANAFQELNDPDEQALRFKEQLANNQKDPMDYDADYIEALEYGMPPAIGFGLGIDRLVMLLTNTQSIKDVILFPTLRPEKTQ